MSSAKILTEKMDVDTWVRTTVTSKAAEVDRILKEFVTNAKDNYLIIGMDTELILTDNQQNSVALLQLYDGDQCLIIQLLHLESLPRSLLNFLRLPIVTLVGFGAKKNMEMLEKEYGLQCRKAVDLEPLCGTGEQNCVPVIQVQGSVSMTDFARVICHDWGAPDLKNAQIRCAMMAAYAAWDKGNRLRPLYLNF